MKNKVLKPKYTDSQPIPEKLADMINCGCTKGRCGDNRCPCKKAAIKFSIVCKTCNGVDAIIQELQKNEQSSTQLYIFFTKYV